MLVRVICPWLGKLPSWMDRFAERVAASAPLVEFVAWPISWAEVRVRCHSATGIMPAETVQPRKICDLRPAFGDIFADKLVGADFWGWCDLDVVFGDLPAFLTPERLESFDLITDNGALVNGPFSILRNDEKTCSLYRRHAAWAKIMGTAPHVAFDELHFSEVVKSSGDVRACFLQDVHGHENDGQGPPTLRDGKLYASDGRELLDYHFVRSGKNGRWPTIRS